MVSGTLANKISKYNTKIYIRIPYSSNVCGLHDIYEEIYTFTQPRCIELIELKSYTEDIYNVTKDDSFFF